MTTGHPTPALISAYASGAASQGVSLAVAAHLTYCAACRDRATSLEAFAGALLQSESDVEAPDIGGVLGRLDEAPPEAPAAEVDAGPLPRPIAEMIGVEFGDIPWRFRLPGVHEYVVSDENGEEISLLKVKPGVAIPQHTHEADELTVVLDGELSDQGHTFRIGELAIADPSVDHHPRASGDRTCICLAVLTGGLKFTGPFGRALNLFT